MSLEEVRVKAQADLLRRLDLLRASEEEEEALELARIHGGVIARHVKKTSVEKKISIAQAAYDFYFDCLIRDKELVREGIEESSINYFLKDK